MNAQSQVPADHPMIIAWELYKGTEDYTNTRKWAAIDEHRDGSLWAAFVEGWNAAAALTAEIERTKE